LLDPNGRLSNSTRFFYGFGSVAYGVKDSGFIYFLLLYYNQVLGLSSQLASLAIFIALVVDALSDPIVGNLSDRLHSRWGRRHPFMYASAVPVALSYYLLWNPPELTEQQLFYYLVVVAVFVRTFITFYEVPSTALAPELTGDYDERTKLASARHFFGWAGGIGIAVIAYLFLLVPTAEQKTGQLNASGYESLGLLGSCMIFVAIMVSSLGTHKYIPDLKLPPPKRRMSLAKTLHENRETLSNRSFFAIFGFGIFAAMGGGFSGAMSIYINTYFWELRADQIGLLAPSGFLSAAIALFAAPYIASRFGKKRSAIATALMGAFFVPVPILGRYFELMPENGSPALLPCLIVYNIVEIALVIIATTLVSAMMADVVEDSELKTGRRSEGIFFAARSFISKSLSGLGIVAGTFLLGLIQFPQNAQPGEVDAGIVMALGLGYAPIVALLYLTAIACLGAYSISREQHLANLELLEESRAGS
jgi:GPH family glycoside/pentoside/hexuronide:cation symporter